MCSKPVHNDRMYLDTDANALKVCFSKNVCIAPRTGPGSFMSGLHGSSTAHLCASNQFGHICKLNLKKKIFKTVKEQLTFHTPFGFIIVDMIPEISKLTFKYLKISRLRKQLKRTSNFTQKYCLSFGLVNISQEMNFSRKQKL